jgi:PAS domain S-box-containing protein
VRTLARHEWEAGAVRDLVVRGGGGLNVLAFPADDEVLIERVRDVLEDCADVHADTARHLLCERLRLVYPDLDVLVRDPLSGFLGSTLYLFRDGSVESRLGATLWASDPTTARVVTDRRGMYVEANEAAAHLFGVAPEQILGQPAGSFTRPDARIRDADELWAVLAESGRLHSLALVRRPDGSDIRVEFVTIHDGAGSGRHVTTLRPVG